MGKHYFEIYQDLFHLKTINVIYISHSKQKT